MVPRGAFAMNRLVAPLAGHQGLPPTRGQASDPEGLLPPSWLAQVGECADVVHFAVLRGATPFTCLSEKALDHLAAMAVHVLRLLVEDGLLLPSQLDAAEPCHQWFLPVAPCVSGCQHLEGAVSPVHRRPVLPEDLARAGAVCIREGEDQEELHDTVDSPEAVDVVGEHVVPDEAPVFRLILRHDAVLRVVDTRRQMDYLSSPRVLGAFGSDDFSGNLQSRGAVDAASVLGPTPL